MDTNRDDEVFYPHDAVLSAIENQSEENESNALDADSFVFPPKE